MSSSLREEVRAKDSPTAIMGQGYGSLLSGRTSLGETVLQGLEDSWEICLNILLREEAYGHQGVVPIPHPLLQAPVGEGHGPLQVEGHKLGHVGRGQPVQDSDLMWLFMLSWCSC